MMLAQFLILVMLIMSSTTTLAAAATSFPIVRPGCNDSCGDVKIPYPFGMTDGCYHSEPFLVTCDSSYSPPKPYKGSVDVTKISLEGQLHVLTMVARKCYNESREIPDRGLDPFLRLVKYTVNHTVNKFTAVGCDTYGFIEGLRGDSIYTTGCLSICDSILQVSDGVCSGGGCCQTSIPKRMEMVNVTAGSFRNHKRIDSFNPCSSAFIAEQGSFNFSFDMLRNLENIAKLPLVLDWTIGDETCDLAQDSSDYACQNNTNCLSDPDSYRGYRCSCLDGYEGNPYLPGVGCQDIDECEDENLNKCTFKELCKNTQGGYECSCPQEFHGNGRGEGGCIRDRRENHRSLFADRITAVLAIAIAVLVIVSSWLYLVSKKKRLTLEKQKFFEKNGGLVLQERLINQEGSAKFVKLFSAKELEIATNNFNESCIIGEGGFGTVYKGLLTDYTIVAIKKSKVVDRSQIDQFINEVLVLSQTNHKNVVKLLGCCLETEVPLLVYEFIENGTLFYHLQNKDKASAFSWRIRLQIAAETAEALSYLHSAASPPIIHRDVKSVNILLDNKWTTKVSDFGASRLVPLEQTELPTMVQGTLGYLDPEYLQTSQLTEKSDVYSFGVVLVELLTGKKALCYERSERERNLANYFLSSLKSNQLLEILEDGIVNERNIEQIKGVAILAKRCLNVKGEDRPAMKEVASELEWLRMNTEQYSIKGHLSITIQPWEYEGFECQEEEMDGNMKD